MKDAEDEAFDELAKRQGHWGGGYQAKRAMAADKLQDGKCKLCVDGCAACDARAQPAQEPDLTEQGRKRSAILGNNVESMVVAGLPFLKALETALKVYDHPTPPKREWVGLTPEDTSGFTQHEMTVVKYVSKVLQEKNT